MNESEPPQDALALIFRQRLCDERDALRRESEGRSAERAPVALDQQSVGRLSRMDALQGQAMAQAADRRRQMRGSLIAAALQRIEDGEYGYCVDCGDFIGMKRLEFDPAAPRCIACASRAGA